MTVASLKIGKREFVVIPKREYERFQMRRDTTKRNRKGLSAEDRADLAIALKRLSDPREKRTVRVAHHRESYRRL